MIPLILAPALTNQGLATAGLVSAFFVGLWSKNYQGQDYNYDFSLDDDYENIQNSIYSTKTDLTTDYHNGVETIENYTIPFIDSMPTNEVLEEKTENQTIKQQTTLLEAIKTGSEEKYKNDSIMISQISKQNENLGIQNHILTKTLQVQQIALKHQETTVSQIIDLMAGINLSLIQLATLPKILKDIGENITILDSLKYGAIVENADAIREKENTINVPPISLDTPEINVNANLDTTILNENNTKLMEISQQLNEILSKQTEASEVIKEHYEHKKTPILTRTGENITPRELEALKNAELLNLTKDKNDLNIDDILDSLPDDLDFDISELLNNFKNIDISKISDEILERGLNE